MDDQTTIHQIQFQGVCVFIFYIVLNNQVKSRWIAQKKSRVPSRATKSKSAATKSTAISAATKSATTSFAKTSATTKSNATSYTTATATTKSPASRLRLTADTVKVTTTEINLELEEMTSAGWEDNSQDKDEFPAVENKIADI